MIQQILRDSIGVHRINSSVIENRWFFWRCLAFRDESGVCESATVKAREQKQRTTTTKIETIAKWITLQFDLLHFLFGFEKIFTSDWFARMLTNHRTEVKKISIVAYSVQRGGNETLFDIKTSS